MATLALPGLTLWKPVWYLSFPYPDLSMAPLVHLVFYSILPPSVPSPVTPEPPQTPIALTKPCAQKRTGINNCKSSRGTTTPGPTLATTTAPTAARTQIPPSFLVHVVTLMVMPLPIV